MTTQGQLLPSAVPMPWRKTTPWHAKLGARALRFQISGASTSPSAAAPQLVNFRYDAATMDRVIGFTVAWLNPGTSSPTDFVMIENNTGWLFDLTYLGLGGISYTGNLETLPDEINLSFYWTNDLPSNAYVSLFNNEMVPFYSGPAQ